MTPSQGRIVCFKGLEANGSDEHPAIVTYAFNPNMVNVTVFPDNGVEVENEHGDKHRTFALAFTSVHFFQTRADKDAYEAALVAEDPEARPAVKHAIYAFPYRD